MVDKIKKNDNAQISANTLYYLGSTLGFDFSLTEKELSEEELLKLIHPLYKNFEIDSTIPPKQALDLIIEKRKQARIDKNWVESDRIRNELLTYGIGLKDSKEGTTWIIL